MIKIRVKNIYDGQIVKRNGVFKSLKSNQMSHGHGLSSVKRVVNRNNGDLSINYDDRVFDVSVLLFNIE